jgi:hypothetical protein
MGESRVVEVWRDVSERSRPSQTSHSERLASLGILAAGVAHEINNPLASVLVAVESVQRRLAAGSEVEGSCTPDPEILELLDVMERETRRCRDISDKLTLLAQPPTGPSAWADLNHAVRDTLTLLRYAMKRQEVTVEESLDSGLPAIWARRRHAERLHEPDAQRRSGDAERGTLAFGPPRRQSRRSEVATRAGLPPAHDRIWDPSSPPSRLGRAPGSGSPSHNAS